MLILTRCCSWLASGLIAVAVSSLAFVGAGIAYEQFELQQRFGVDDDVCWLALVVGPALIVVIHRALLDRAWVSVTALSGGLVLTGVGVMQFMSARGAQRRHVPFGPFSGIEHGFTMALGLFAMTIAALLILAGGLAFAARHLHHRTEMRVGGNAAPPRASP